MRLSLSIFSIAAAISVTGLATAPHFFTADRGSGRLTAELADRGSGRITLNSLADRGSGRGPVAYRGSGRIMQDEAYRGSGRVMA